MGGNSRKQVRGVKRLGKKGGKKKKIPWLLYGEKIRGKGGGISSGKRVRRRVLNLPYFQEEGKKKKGGERFCSEEKTKGKSVMVAQSRDGAVAEKKGEGKEKDHMRRLRQPQCRSAGRYSFEKKKRGKKGPIDRKLWRRMEGVAERLPQVRCDPGGGFKKGGGYCLRPLEEEVSGRKARRDSSCRFGKGKTNPSNCRPVERAWKGHPIFSKKAVGFSFPGPNPLSLSSPKREGIGTESRTMSVRGSLLPSL